MPSNEQFDTMNDASFEAWWDHHCEDVQMNSTTEEEVEAVFEARYAAYARRTGEV